MVPVCSFLSPCHKCVAWLITTRHPKSCELCVLCYSAKSWWGWCQATLNGWLEHVQRCSQGKCTTVLGLTEYCWDPHSAGKKNWSSCRSSCSKSVGWLWHHTCFRGVVIVSTAFEHIPKRGALACGTAADVQVSHFYVSWSYSAWDAASRVHTNESWPLVWVAPQGIQLCRGLPVYFLMISARSLSCYLKKKEVRALCCMVVARCQAIVGVGMSWVCLWARCVCR